MYCAQGRHRSVAMAAAILIARGYTVSEALDLLCTRRRAADPKTWHIYQRIQAFEKYWHNETSGPNGIITSISEAYSEFVTTLVSKVILRLIGPSRGFLSNTHISSLNLPKPPRK